MTPLLNFMVDLPDPAMQRLLWISSMSDCISREPEIAAQIASRGDMCWSFQTYLNLSEHAPFSVVCSNRLRDDAINFVHSDQLANIGGRASAFIVCMRADYPSRRWAHCHIVQNRRQASSQSFWMPLWVQPGIRKRDRSRRDVLRVAYVGQTFNGNLAADPAAWRSAFNPTGLEFVAPPCNAWHDFSAIDILIGLRSFDRRTYPTKPPSKLINAWHAEAPFIGGYDSAYEQVGSPGEDYIRAGSLREVVAAAMFLRDNPYVYDRMVSAGARRAERYSVQSICGMWAQTIETEIAPRHRRWQMRSSYEGGRYFVMRGLGRLEKASRAIMRRAIDLSAG